MSVLQNNQIKIPYFNQGENLRVGLNLLGLRNASESLYTRILPGLNNVTLHIRYYSFYCWIFREYYRICKLTSASPSRESFNKFIRRAEYLLAILEASKGDESKGVPGINFALTDYENFNGVIDIAKAADKIPGNETYWANPGGALSQYYAASLFDMGIVGDVVQDNRMINISLTTENDFITGEMLADAFQDSVGSDGEIFLHFVEKGLIDEDSIESLRNSFFMHKMGYFDKERELLLRMLVQKDSPSDKECKTYRRRETIRYYLQYCINEPGKCSDLGFARYMHDRVEHESISEETALGWSAFYLNDMWQYYETIIFTELLDILKESGSMYIDSVVAELSQRILDIYKSTSIKDVLDEVKNTDTSLIEDSGKSCFAFYSLLRLIAENGTRLSDVMQIYQIQSNNYFDFAQRLMECQTSLEDFVKDFIQQDIIYRHYALSFQKQQYTGIATQKFVIENDVMRFCDSYFATHTSPRIDSLKNFLHDLCLLDDEDKVTPEGMEYLNNAES